MQRCPANIADSLLHEELNPHNSKLKTHNSTIDIMETRKHIAAAKKQRNTHNCAQAILTTYADVAGVDEQTAMDIAGAFGVGMGNMEGTCGALVGAGLVLGMKNKDRAHSMKQMRKVMTRFQERNGATQCKLLKGVGTKQVLRQCPDCVADASEFLEEQLQEHEPKAL